MLVGQEMDLLADLTVGEPVVQLSAVVEVVLQM
jgi:hypothetical protein